MKYINIRVRAEVEENLYGKVSDEIWEKYQNGDIPLDALYANYFDQLDADQLDYEVTEVENAEED